MKVPITKARVKILAKYRQEGSVLAQTIEAWCAGVETHLEVESPAPPEKVAGVIRNAENGCFAIQAVRRPSPVHTTVSLNGQALDLESSPRP